MARSRIHLLLVVGVSVLALGIAMGISLLVKRTNREAFLSRLPDMPALAKNAEVLRQKLIDADQITRRTVREGKPYKQFGRKAGELGRFYQANHFYDQAIPCYRLAIELDHEEPLWSYLLASVYQQRGQNESVRVLLERTLKLAPDYSPALLKLADSFFKTGKKDQAKGSYSLRLALLPGDPYALLGLARIALAKSQWDEAQGYLERAIESDPGFGDAHRLLSTVHEHFFRNRKAQESLKAAGRCTRFVPAADPWVDALEDLCYDTEQLLVLGEKAIAERKIKKALDKYFHRAMELDPRNLKVHLAVGKAWLMLSQLEPARHSFRNTLDLDPENGEAHFYLGLIMRNEGKLFAAENMFLRALEFESNNPNVYNNLGLCILEQHKYEEAIKYFRQALEIYPEHLEALYNLGVALWASGNSMPAVKQYKRVLQTKPDWRTPANSLAWILATDIIESMRNGDEAVHWALLACKGEGWENPEYLDTLAAAYAEAGRFDQAVQTAQRALGLARAKGDTILTKDLEYRLRLYGSGKAFHE
jgi:tetratricopeptide (TPR) repeat protein